MRRKYSNRLISGWILLTFLAACTSTPRSTPASKTYLENLEAFISSSPKIKDFDITIKTVKFKYQIGEEIKVNFTSTKDCYLILLAIHSNNNANIIIPNKNFEYNFFKAGEHSLTFYASGPTGLERFKAFATLEKEIPLKFNFSKDFHNINQNTVEGKNDIRALVGMPSINKKTGWAEAYHEITILKNSKDKSRGPKKSIKKPKKPKGGLGTIGQLKLP